MPLHQLMSDSLIERLTKVDNRLRARLPAQLGIPSVKLVRWTLDGVATPQLKCKVVVAGAPKQQVYLNAAVNSGLRVNDETLIIKDIPRVNANENLLRYGIVDICELDAPELVIERAEVAFLDTSKTTVYEATVNPIRNR